MLVAWASVLPPVFAFTALAILVSVATRSSAAGIGVPVLVGFAMELASQLDAPELLRQMLLTPPLGAWHGLFAEPPFHGPLVQGLAICGAYFASCLTVAYRLVRARDVGG